MRAVVLYETLTGNTRLAGELAAAELLAAGIPTTVFPVSEVDAASLDAADLVVLGSWTDGFIFAGQRPGRSGKLRRVLPDLGGKRGVVFCTYAVDPGRTLDKLATIMSARGAEVLGGMAIHRKRIPAETQDFAERLLETVRA